MEEILDNELIENGEYITGGTETADPHDPFDNPTEYHLYNDDYSEIVPQIKLKGCRIPRIPSESEKKRIRYFYNIGGGGVALHFVLTFVTANALQMIITLIIMALNGLSFSELSGAKGQEISSYIRNSAILPGITLLSYLFSNLLSFFVGIKVAGIKFSSLFRTRDLKVPDVIKYILIALFIQQAVGMAVNILGNLVQGVDVVGSSQDLMTFSSNKSMLLSLLYMCVVAPVTEEFFCRGFVLKTFSKVSQRFGIFMSAFFFGISHGNIAQFALAFTLGIFMGYIDIRHNSLLPSVLVHFSTNALSAASLIIAHFSGTSSAVYIVLGYAVMGVALLGLVMLVLFCRSNVFPRYDMRQQFRCKNIAVRSVGTIAAAAIYIILFINGTFSS
ncbi:MAG: lysostaphin resistance A-like protein [Porcipelethomonas sp.]